MGQQVGSCALAVELQSGEGETNSSSIQACLQQAVGGFSSGPWRGYKVCWCPLQVGDMGTPGGGKEGGVSEGPQLTALGYRHSWRLLLLPKASALMG